MKITKSRLLQIIREEVELHEKYMEENFVELDEESLQDISSEEEADTNGDGNISKKEASKVFKKEQEADEEVGNLDEINVELEEIELPKEDKLFNPKTKKPIKPKKQK